MDIEKNHFISYIINKISLEILESGFVDAGTDWIGKNICSPFSRVYYIESGEGIIKYKNVKITMKPGNIYLIPAGLKYSFWCENSLRKAYFHINVFKPDGYDLFMGAKKCCEVKSTKTDIARVIEAYKGTDIKDVMAIKYEMYNAVARFLPQLDIESISHATYSGTVQKAIDYIQLNLSNNLTLVEIADKTYISPNTLRKKFKDEVGITLGQYIDDLLFFTAERLLQKSDWSIEEISENLGYCDRFYFSKRFKERYNMTPSRYRKQYKSAL